MVSSPKLYEDLAKWWPLLSPPEEYADEAEFFLEVFERSEVSPLRTMVEFGSGGGSNAFYLKNRFALTLVDISPDMLAISRTLNPECEHLVEDMRSVRLERQFDAVFIHDAIEYMTTPDDLAQAIQTAFVHCRPGGIALFVPDNLRDTFEPSSDCGGHDGEGRGLRYLEWSFDPDPSDTSYVNHYVFMLREGNEVRVEHDPHQLGLFARSEWLRLLGEAGFEVSQVTDEYDRELFVALRPLR